MKHLAEAKQDIAARVKLTDSLKNSKKNLRPIDLLKHWTNKRNPSVALQPRSSISSGSLVLLSWSKQRSSSQIAGVKIGK